MRDIEAIGEPWEVDCSGEIFQTTMDDLAVRIADGSLLRIDRVRRADLRWIEAGKVPDLVEFFNKKDASQPPAPTIRTYHKEVLGAPRPQVFTNSTPSPAGTQCSMHPDAPAVYRCDACLNLFCRSCPTGYGSSVKICPFCGAMCRALSEQQSSAAPAISADNARFGIADVGRAFAFPFKFKLSFLFGSILFAFFSIGRGAAGFGGMSMVAGSTVCLLGANMLTFGVLNTTINNLIQGKPENGFMPPFEDFSIWDDVVHPFFLSVGVYAVSFGPVVIVLIAALYFNANPTPKDVVTPAPPVGLESEISGTANTVEQGIELRDLVNAADKAQQKRVDAIEKGEVPVANEYEKPAAQADLASAPPISKTEGDPFTEAAPSEYFFGGSRVVLALAALAFIWGLLFFPAACAVAGYTGSFAATMNAGVGLDTIKRLGSPYALTVGVGIVLLGASVAASSFFSLTFSAVDLPGIGNIPATILNGCVSFYLWIVWSYVLGYMLNRGADKLELSR